MTQELSLRAFFDQATNTVTYLVWDAKTRIAAVIDSVLDYDPGSGKVSAYGVDKVLAAAASEKLQIQWVLETHAHADHLSAAQHIKAKTKAKVGIGEHICKVQQIFQSVFNVNDVSQLGTEFDHLFKDGEEFQIGELTAHVLHTPGHTPACVSYRLGDAVFVGDTLFMPDYGTARADFPGGDARQLFRSIKRTLSLPSATRVFTCHDYKTPDREAYAWESTVGEQRAHNVQIHDGVSEDAFVTMRQARDASLAVPRLLFPSIQINIRAGRFPAPESNGTTYLKVPISFAEGVHLPER